jgi:DNA-binding transcriptional ArsR family regulator
MTERQTADPVFFAIAHPVRRDILDLALARDEVPIGALRTELGLTAPALSQHLRTLEAAGLIAIRRAGRRGFVRATPEPLIAIVDWMLRFRGRWSSTLDRLGAYLDGDLEPPLEHPGRRAATPVRSDRSEEA